MRIDWTCQERGAVFSFVELFCFAGSAESCMVSYLTLDIYL